jgi:predicted acetyltransferase
MPASTPPEPATIRWPGRNWFGAFAGDQLVAQMIDRECDSYFGGATVPTAGIASVSVAMEFRGQGLLSPMFAATLRAAKQRGAVVSTLFPTAPRIYRRFGYELIADFVTAEIPTSALTAVAPAAGVTTRRATPNDVAAIREIYDGWAIEQNGPLTRRGLTFPTEPQDVLDRFTGVTVAEDAAGVCGYASWKRGQGYGDQASLAVSDLLARTPEGYRALLAAVGSFASVTGTTKFDTSGDDLARLFLPGRHWPVVSSAPYMLKILDVPRAVEARRYPPRITAELPFELAGDFLPENDGSYLLRVADGRASCVRVDTATGTFSPAGLALLYAGTQSCGNLRAAGLLRGGDRDDDLDWDALFGGRQPHIRDYF